MDALNRNELEALRILWENRQVKPAEVQARFGWKIENATLRSVLVNLVAKGHVTRKQKGKAFFYSADVPKKTLLSQTVQALVRAFAGGSSRELLTQLVETGDIKPSDLRIVRQATHSRNKTGPSLSQPRSKCEGPPRSAKLRRRK